MKRWWMRDPHDEALLEDSGRRLAEARAQQPGVLELVGYLRQKQIENHIGEKMHNAFRRPEEQAR